MRSRASNPSVSTSAEEISSVDLGEFSKEDISNTILSCISASPKVVLMKLQSVSIYIYLNEATYLSSLLSASVVALELEGPSSTVDACRLKAAFRSLIKRATAVVLSLSVGYGVSTDLELECIRLVDLREMDSHE